MQAVDTFVVKIGDSNAASLALFRKLGFQPFSHSDVFKETCLCLTLRDGSAPELVTTFARGIFQAPLH